VSGRNERTLDRVMRARWALAAGDYGFVDALLASAEGELAEAVEDGAEWPCDPSERAWQALMLAPTIETWDALLAGEAVPLSCLDQEWVERFGLREGAR
jgi:hypothetical protein